LLHPLLEQTLNIAGPTSPVTLGPIHLGAELCGRDLDPRARYGAPVVLPTVAHQETVGLQCSDRSPDVKEACAGITAARPRPGKPLPFGCGRLDRLRAHRDLRFLLAVPGQCRVPRPGNLGGNLRAQGLQPLPGRGQSGIRLRARLRAAEPLYLCLQRLLLPQQLDELPECPHADIGLVTLCHRHRRDDLGVDELDHL